MCYLNFSALDGASVCGSENIMSFTIIFERTEYHYEYFTLFQTPENPIEGTKLPSGIQYAILSLYDRARCRTNTVNIGKLTNLPAELFRSWFSLLLLPSTGDVSRILGRLPTPRNTRLAITTMSLAATLQLRLNNNRSVFLNLYSTLLQNLSSSCCILTCNRLTAPSDMVVAIWRDSASGNK
jgi:hypothetical protein